MKRPILWAFGASVLGEILAYRFSEVKVVWLAVIVVLAVWFLMWFGQNWRWLFLPVFLLCGFIWMQKAMSPSELDAALRENQQLEGVGVGVVTDLRRNQGGWKIVLSDLCWEDKKQAWQGDGLIFYMEETPNFYPGDTLVIKGKVVGWEKATNPGQFDGEFYYQAQKIDGQCFSPEILSIKSGQLWVAKGIYRARTYFTNVLEHIGSMSETQSWKETIGVLQGMLLGERGLVSDEVEDALSVGGISHILAISGLHISLLGLCLFHLLKQRLLCPYSVSVLLSLAAVIVYCAMAGKTASSARALCMYAAMLVGEMQARPYDLISACSLSGILILADQPMLLFQAGFQLSFAAIAGMGLICPILERWFSFEKAGKAFLVMLSVQIATLPVLAWHYYEVSFGGLLLNLLVIPMMPFLAGMGFGGMLMGCVFPTVGAVMLFPVHILLQMMKMLSGWMGEFPGVLWCMGRPKWYCMVLYGLFWCAVVWYGAKWKKRKCSRNKKIGLAMMMVVVVLMLGYTPQQKLRITFLDVGQGDCSLVGFPNGQTMLIDCGSSNVKDVGEYRLLSALKYYGITQLDYVVVTHLDEDHMNGIFVLLEQDFAVGRVLLSDAISKEEQKDAFCRWLEQKEIAYSLIGAGSGIQMGDVALRCLYPISGSVVNEENDTSVVLWLEYGAFGALFAGDLGGTFEGELVKRLPDLREKQVLLKVAHHGSRYSTGMELLTCVMPDWAIISCAKNNGYGHPHKEVLERLGEVSGEIWDTPSKGAIFVTTDGEEVSVSAYCDLRKAVLKYL